MPPALAAAMRFRRYARLAGLLFNYGQHGTCERQPFGNDPHRHRQSRLCAAVQNACDYFQCRRHDSARSRGMAYNAMRQFVQQHYPQALELAMSTLMIAGAIAVGLVLSEVLNQIFHSIRFKPQR